MDNNLDSVFFALSDPTRRAIIERLLQGSAPVSELHAPHDMAMPSFMKHLGKLEAAGIVRSHKKGRVRMVHCDPARITAARDWINRLETMWTGRLDRLAQLANTTKKDEENG